MIENAKNTMMGDAPKKKLFHFSGDGIYWPKAIEAITASEAEEIWHKGKQLISQTSAVQPAPHPEPKVEDKPSE